MIRSMRLAPGVHVDRALGGHCDHRGLDRAAVAGRAVGAGVREADAVHQQPEAVGLGRAELPDAAWHLAGADDGEHLGLDERRDGQRPVVDVVDGEPAAAYRAATDVQRVELPAPHAGDGRAAFRRQHDRRADADQYVALPVREPATAVELRGCRRARAATRGNSR